MKTTLLLALLMTTFSCFAQSDQENQNKYWKYREILKDQIC
jgi:hypothetical protein